jgi:hypothetical protein
MTVLIPLFVLDESRQDFDHLRLRAWDYRTILNFGGFEVGGGVSLNPFPTFAESEKGPQPFQFFQARTWTIFPFRPKPL